VDSAHANQGLSDNDVIDAHQDILDMVKTGVLLATVAKLDLPVNSVMTSLVDAHVSHKSKDVNVTRAHRSTSDSPTVRNVSVTLTPKHVTQRLGIVQTVDTIPLAQNVIPVLLDTMVMLHKVPTQIVKGVNVQVEAVVINSVPGVS